MTWEKKKVRPEIGYKTLPVVKSVRVRRLVVEETLMSHGRIHEKRHRRFDDVTSGTTTVPGKTGDPNFGITMMSLDTSYRKTGGTSMCTFTPTQYKEYRLCREEFCYRSRRRTELWLVFYLWYVEKDGRWGYKDENVFLCVTFRTPHIPLYLIKSNLLRSPYMFTLTRFRPGSPLTQFVTPTYVRLGICDHLLVDFR